MKQLLFSIALLLVTLTSYAQKQLWGMSSTNGVIAGTIFKTDSVGDNYTDVYTFSDPANGVDPYGSLMKAADGYLYGLTSRGGAYGFGVLFQLHPVTGAYVKKHDFDSVAGKKPYGSLVQAPNGKLYGMTYGGGSHALVKNMGVLFEYDPVTAGFAVKADFHMNNGSRPYGSLVPGNDGTLYGLSSAGGGDATGLLFQYDIATSAITAKNSFIAGPLWYGYEPHGQLLKATDGALYGLSRYGGAGWAGGGVIFKYDPSVPFSPMSTLHRFIDTLPGAVNGHELMGSLIQATNGKLYGMTQLGGANASGTIFEYDFVADTCIKLYDLNGTTEGFGPYGSLLQASDGRLYGLTTSEGGQARLFRYDIATNILTVKANVTGTPHYTTLIEAVATTTGIAAEPTAVSLVLYPTPAINTINIALPANYGYGTAVITDITGKVVKRQVVTGTSVDVAALQPGMYFLSVTANGNVRSAKFVKE